jgi:hypothetical protein
MEQVPRRSARLAAKQEAAKQEKEQKEVDTWTCPNDGDAYYWNFHGKSYYRTFFGEIYQVADDDKSNDYKLGVWVGMWDAKKQVIDTSVHEPIYADE